MHGRLEILADAEAVALAAAQRIVARLGAKRGRQAIALTGGHTPQALYRLLAKEPWRSRIAWADLHCFWGDERFVPADDPRSNARMAIEALLDHVPVPKANIHRIPTEGMDIGESARTYEDTLRGFHGPGDEQPLFSLVLMGLGADGHTASLFPGQGAVEERERWVVPVAHAGLEPFVPRVTLTLPALAACDEMLFLVSGGDKRDALRRVREGEPIPAGRAHARGELAWIVDRAAAA